LVVRTRAFVPQKAPEEVATDGYEGAILLCILCGQR
jgi:hypothetical protein